MSTVSHSEVEQYLRCERAHYYAYGKEITSIFPGVALRRGKMGHEILEHFHKALLKGQSYEDAFKVAWNFATELLIHDDNAELLNTVLPTMKWYMKEWFPKSGFTVLAVEAEFKLPVSDDLTMPFVTDLLVRDRWGKIILLDMKFVYDFYSEKAFSIMPQLPKYAGGLRALGYPVDSVGYMMFRYRNNAKAASVADRFQYEVIQTTDSRVSRTFTEQVVASERILELKKKPLEEWEASSLRCMNSKICDSCQFYHLCMTDLSDPEQSEIVEQAYYEKRQRRTFGDENDGE